VPGDLTQSVAVGVIPQSLSTAFVESREYLQLQSRYHDGVVHRGQLALSSRKSWKQSKKLTAVQLLQLNDIWIITRAGTYPAYFYDPFSGDPVGSNFDPTGASTVGRYNVAIRGPWSQSSGMMRTQTSIELVELPSAITLAELSITSSETVGPSYSAAASIRVSTDGSVPSQLFGPASVTFAVGPYTNQTDTISIDPANIGLLQIWASLIGSLSGGSTNNTPANLNTLTISDIHVNVTFDDGSTGVLYPTSSGSRLPLDNGTGSFYSLSCNHFNPLAAYSDFYVGGFVLA
jgi:hypothetical protein